jgi:hypothetical protein
MVVELISSSRQPSGGTVWGRGFSSGFYKDQIKDAILGH